MWPSNKTLLFFNTNFSDSVTKSFVDRQELILISYVTNNLPLLLQVQKVSKYINWEYQKSQSSFIYLFEVGTRTRGFNKISIKLRNRCVGLSGPPDTGLPLKSWGQ